ncbi:MAG: hypothetical protein BWX69_03214 [Planctomycetes bacterium ADurb.Bin069]|nr:MAG: hypothetical protein BWX69_03214 [Planctomycetes bacterium ADurb.Bin069]
MSDDDAVEAGRRYERAAHRVQSGIAALIGMGRAKMVEPKHLRVGIDLQKADTAGLVGLLIAKGVLTRQEYLDAVAASAEAEAEAYEAHLSAVLGAKVTTA